MQALNRRQAITGAALTLAGLASRSTVFAQQSAQAMQEKPSADTTKSLTALHLSVPITALPERVYVALLDAKLFAAFSGLPAIIDPAAGGSFSLFSAQILGRNVESVPARRLVQAWRPASWSPGVYSIVRFDFAPAGSGSTLEIDHKGFPAGDYDHLLSGWEEHYAEPLKKYFVKG